MTKKDGGGLSTATVIHWTVLVALVVFLSAAVVLGVSGVLGEDNTVRLVLGLVALLAYIVRRGPPAGSPPVAGELGTLLLLVGLSSEFGGTLVQLIGGV